MCLWNLFLSRPKFPTKISLICNWHCKGYSVCSGYQLHTSHDFTLLDASENLIWHTQVSLKVSILSLMFASWQVATKINLLNHGIIHAKDISCLAGCGYVESAQHLLLHCDTFGSLWQQVRLWLGVSGVDHQSLSAHFFQFTNYLGGLRTRRSFLQLFWLLCVWLIWKERNNRIFNNIYISITEVMEKVKFHSYWWLRANNANFVYDWLSTVAVGSVVLFGYRLMPVFVFVIIWQTLCILNDLFSTSCVKETSLLVWIYTLFAS